MHKPRVERTKLEVGGKTRTSNMWCISMTLEMLRLSGWLNADAPCRVNREHVKRPGCKARRAPETGGCGATCGVK